MLALEGTIVSGARSYKIEVELATFVRDVGAELPGGRVIPPPHPPISGLGLSAAAASGAASSSRRLFDAGR